MGLYTLSAEIPFLDHLARDILERFAAPSEVLVLLPSRRACISLREAFLNAQGGKPLLLPRIQPIGDVSEDELSSEAWLTEELRERVIGLKPAISTRKREMLLAELVAQFYRKEQTENFVHEHALRLARELARLMDEAEREQVDLSKLAEIVPAELAVHWQQTLTFLQIITNAWPEVLAQENRMNPIARRNELLSLLAETWSKKAPEYPVIAAGSTGSTPATATLLKVVAGLPKGEVWLPGLDLSMTEDTWDYVAPTHPQYALKKLLEFMAVKRDAVQPLLPEPSTARGALWQTAMLPAEATAAWRNCKLDGAAALTGISKIEAADQQEEAQTIAAILRDALDIPEKKLALVTHDRTLARMVSAELKRYGIAIDDSAGAPLIATPPAQYLRLLAEMVAAKAAPVPLLAFLKHPLTACGMARAECREAARELETLVLRGERLKPGFATLRRAVMTEKAGAEVGKLLLALDNAAQPLAELFTQKKARFIDLLDAHLRAAENLSSAELLWSGEPGEQLAAILAEWREFGAGLNIAPADYPSLLVTLLESEVHRARFGTHPRLHLLSPIEARLQHFDLVVLGEMNEGTWPQAVQASPWMSRPMQQKLGLSPLERGIGQSAHDFVLQAVSANEVVLTRARRVQGKPAIPSRWWLRFEALLKGLGLAVPEHVATQWVQQLNVPESLPPISAPSPRPPLDARPRKLPVTAIEKWLRDPYSIYAQYILKLKRIDEVDQMPDASQFGNLVHKALEHFIKQYPENLPENPEAALLACGKEVFDTQHHAAAKAFWWPRFEAIARAIAAEEKARRGALRRVLGEVKEAREFTTPAGAFNLTARMDRVEEQQNGALAIVDYKTGTVPSKKNIQEGLSSQLLLEALIAGQDKTVAALEYWRLAGSTLDIKSFAEMNLDLGVLMQEAEAGLMELVQLFEEVETPYLACPDAGLAPRYNDYEHLERTEEWA